MSGTTQAFPLDDEIPSDEDLRDGVSESVTEQPSAPVAEPVTQDDAQEAASEADDADEAPEQGRRVPLPELLKEREKRRALEKRLQEIEERGNSRLERLLEAMQRPATPEPAPPALPPLESDPVNHFAQRFETTEQRLARIEAESQAAAQQREFATRVQQAEARFAQETPDYLEAVQHLRASFAQEEQHLGLPPGHLAQSVAMQALQAGRNPAEVAYQLAKVRGYARQEAPAAADRTVEAVDRGQRASRSVAATPGKAPTGRMSLQALADMPEAEFEALYRRMNDQQQREFNKLLRSAG